MAIKTGNHGNREFMLIRIDACHCFLASRSRLIFGFKLFLLIPSFADFFVLLRTFVFRTNFPCLNSTLRDFLMILVETSISIMKVNK